MSKVAKIIGVVAAVVAIAATGIGLVLGPAAFAATFGASAATIAAVASVVSTIAMAVAQATMKPPDMKGSVNQVVIGKNMPVPYSMGRTYTGGLQVYDDSAGEKNRMRFQVMVVSAAGPIQEVEDILYDYTPATLDGSGNATGWFDGFLDVQTRLGNRPETAFDGGGVVDMPNWTSAHKLSGFAAYRVKMKFDKDGKKFASGVPQWGMVGKMVKVYDPRLDTTYPGGSGAHRWDNEATWAWSENPALHALAYARGRFVNGIKVVGCGFDQVAIDVAQFVELANVCDANDWTIGGTIYEGPGTSKWDNLKRLLQAAAAEPVWTGGMLSLKISAPKVPVVTIGVPDLADGEIAIQAMKGWRDKINTIVPRVRLEDQKWEYVQLEEVTDSVYLTEDGEPKIREVQYDLVQDKDQGAELGAYELVNSREFGPIQLQVKPHMMVFRPGEAVTLDLPEAGLEGQVAVITGRQVDPSTGAVMLILESETAAKHPFALGTVGVAPPSPTIHDPETMDEAAGDPAIADTSQLVANSAVRNMTSSITTAGVVTVSTHERVYIDKIVSVTGATVTPSPTPSSGDMVGVFYDDEDRLGGAVTYQYDVIAGGVGDIDHMFASADNPYRHFVVMIPVPATGTTSGGSGVGTGSGGTGGGAGGGYWNTNYL